MDFDQYRPRYEIDAWQHKKYYLKQYCVRINNCSNKLKDWGNLKSVIKKMHLKIWYGASFSRPRSATNTTQGTRSFLLISPLLVNICPRMLPINIHYWVKIKRSSYRSSGLNTLCCYSHNCIALSSVCYNAMKNDLTHTRQHIPIMAQQKTFQ